MEVHPSSSRFGMFCMCTDLYLITVDSTEVWLFSTSTRKVLKLMFDCTEGVEYTHAHDVAFRTAVVQGIIGEGNTATTHISVAWSW